MLLIKKGRNMIIINSIKKYFKMIIEQVKGFFKDLKEFYQKRPANIICGILFITVLCLIIKFCVCIELKHKHKQELDSLESIIDTERSQHALAIKQMKLPLKVKDDLIGEQARLLVEKEKKIASLERDYRICYNILLVNKKIK